MIARKQEYQHLISMYQNNSFEFLVMYGRRRVGKTTLLQEFSKDSNTIFYPAREKNDALNLEDFSKAIQLHIDGNFISPFKTWEDAFDYIDNKVTKRTVLIIDEFPFIAEQNPTIKSILQHTIDHKWKCNDKIFLILCGSSVSFMETDVMGNKSPLHDRQTSSLEILPFDYLDSSLFVKNYSNEHKLLTYGILGGIPRYLESFNDKQTIEENIANKIIRKGSFLHEEPINLLKAELRETNVYNSILSAIANGKNRVIEISDYIHEDTNKVSKYLLTLQTIRLVDKKAPCGESKNGRKGIYNIVDNFLRFWFRYEFSNKTYYELLGAKKSTNEIMNDISNHLGPIFEEICCEYFIRLAKLNKLPFVPCNIGKWWGNNPYIKAQDDVDILMLDKNKDSAIFVECKYTSKPMQYKEYENLMIATKALPYINNKYFYFVSKSGYEKSVIKQAIIDKAVLLTFDDLFEI